MKKRALCLIFGAIFSTNTNAIVSMESLHFGSDEPGFKGSASLAADLARGNSERTRGKGGLTLQWNREDSIYYSSVSAAYGESKNVRDQNEWFFHGRRIGNISPKLSWELFTQVESEEFARLKLRALGGSGMRVLIGEKRSDQSFYAGIGAFYSHEIIDDAQKTTQGEVKGNLYLLFRRALSENASLVNTSYYQPNVADPLDYRLLEKLTLRANVIKRLALRFSWELRIDNRPPTGVKTWDSKLLSGIEYNF